MDKNPSSSSMKENPSDTVDELIDSLGHFGKYQRVIYILACLPTIFAGIQMALPTFTNYVPDYRCLVPDCDVGEQPSYDPHSPWVNVVIPRTDGELSECTTFRYNITSKANKNHECEAQRNSEEEIHCSEWVFDDSEYESTIATEFQIACDRDFLKPLLSSLYMAGLLVGAPLWGFVSDRWGRLIALIGSSMTGGIMGICMGLMPEIISYSFFAFFAGIGNIGVFQSSFLIGVEYVGTRARMVCGIIPNVFFALGETSLAFFAYFIRRWRILQVVVSAPICLTIAYYWILPESPRWLLAKGKWEEARKFALKAAKVNKKDVPEHLLPTEKITIQKEEVPTEKISLLEALKDVVILRMTIIMMYAWFASALTYFALSQNTSNLGGNIYVNFVLTMMAEIPGHIAVMILLNRIGRRICIIGFFFIGGACCIGAGFIPDDQQTAIIIPSLIGKMNVSATFAIVFMYTAEIFPTVIRNSSVGACSMISRAGSISSPFIANLASVSKCLPFLICGGVAVLAAILCLDLPETNGAKLPETLEDCKNLKKQSGGIFSFPTKVKA